MVFSEILGGRWKDAESVWNSWKRMRLISWLHSTLSPGTTRSWNHGTHKLSRIGGRIRFVRADC